MNGRVVMGALLWGIAGAATAAPGDHIRAGDAEIVPDVDAGLEYLTNVYRSEENAVAAGNLRLAPGVTIGLEGPDTDFRLGGEWELRKFIFVGDDSLSDAISSSERIQNLDRFNDFRIGAGANLLKQSVVGFVIEDNIGFRNWETDSPFADVPFMSQFRNNLDGGLRINPGPALELVAGGSWAFDQYYIPGETGDRVYNQRHTYGPGLAARWAFLPRTSLVANVEYLFFRWRDNVVESGDPVVGADLAIPDSSHVKFMTGIDGQFTERLRAEAQVGYGAAFYDGDSASTAEQVEQIGADITGANGILFKLQGSYEVTRAREGQMGSRIALGGSRDFGDSFFTNYLVFYQIYAQYEGRLDRFQPSLRYGIRFEDYTGEIERQDIVNRLNLDVGYWFQDYASLTAGMWWQQRASNQETVEYDNFNLHLLGTFTY